jgi:hypothetical protein
MGFVKVQIDNKKVWIWMFILSILQRPIHEFGHWVIYKFYNVDVYFTFNQVVPHSLKDGNALAAAGGPIINVILAVIGYLIFTRFRKYSEFGLVLSLTNILGRLVPYILIFMLGVQSTNDEGVIGFLTNTSIYSNYIIFGAILFVVLLLNLASLDLDYKNKTFFIIKTLIIFCFGVLVIGEIIQSTFFQNYDVKFEKLR